MAQRVLVLVRIPTSGTEFRPNDGLVVTERTKKAGDIFSSTTDIQAPSKAEDEQSADLYDLTVKLPLAKRFELLLTRLEISQANWFVSADEKFYQVHFTYNGGIYCDKLLQELHDLGVGAGDGSDVVIVPVNYISVERQEELDKVLKDAGEKNKQSFLQQFVKTVGARLTMYEVVSAITESSMITFDYVILVILASIISALGLIADSSVSIVASMLISPLMGPILGIVFGLVVGERALLKTALKSETAGLLLCLIVGFLIGLIAAAFKIKSEFSFLLTDEICSRGQLSSLLMGILVALPSGAGVALSVLGGNIGSLVGVAISASLLPPAVNCGLLFGYAAIVRTSHKVTSGKPSTPLESYLCPSLHNLSGVDPLILSKEAARIGGFSFLLTLLNILCIILMGIIVLKIKEVAPLSKNFSDSFWHEDVKISKDYYQTIEKIHSDRFKTEFIQYCLNLYGLDINKEEDRNITSAAAYQKIARLTNDLEDLNTNVTMASKNVYRYGPSQNKMKENAIKKIVSDLPPKWTEMFRQSNEYKQFPPVETKSDRFKIIQVKHPDQPDV